MQHGTETRMQHGTETRRFEIRKLFLASVLAIAAAGCGNGSRSRGVRTLSQLPTTPAQ
jgi:hypothetical protein